MKPLRSVDELALFGAPPAFADVVHVGRPNVGNRDEFHRYLDSALDDLWLTNDGRLVRELETQLVERLGVEHCVVTSSGTSALEIAVRALGMTGDVALPSFTFVATANAVAWSGGRPVFCDAERDTGNVSAASVRAHTGSSTTGILGVHLYGQPCDVDELETRALELSVPLLLDASQALGSRYGANPVGTRGTAEVLSFHATKIVNSFEGGAVVTRDAALATELRQLRNHGYSKGHVHRLATNAKLSEAHAAMGLANLPSLERFVEANRENLAAYRRGLADTPGCAFLVDSDRTNGHYVVLLVDEAAAELSRDRLLDVLRAENVAARPYFHPGCHALGPYATARGAHTLPDTEWLAQRVLCLPNGITLGRASATRIAELVRFTLSHGAEVKDRMSRSKRAG